MIRIVLHAQQQIQNNVFLAHPVRTFSQAVVFPVQIAIALIAKVIISSVLNARQDLLLM